MISFFFYVDRIWGNLLPGNLANVSVEIGTGVLWESWGSRSRRKAWLNVVSKYLFKAEGSDDTIPIPQEIPNVTR